MTKDTGDKIDNIVSDVDKLKTAIGALVAIDIPEAGDADELGDALSALSRRAIKLTEKFARAKALETSARLTTMQMKHELEVTKSVTIRDDDDFAALKNENQRSAYLMGVHADEYEALKDAEKQHRLLQSVLEMIEGARDCLKFLKENVARQIQLMEIDAILERKIG